MLRFIVSMIEVTSVLVISSIALIDQRRTDPFIANSDWLNHFAVRTPAYIFYFAGLETDRHDALTLKIECEVLF